LIVVPRWLLAAPFLVRRTYLAVVPRPLSAVLLAVRRTYGDVTLSQQKKNTRQMSRRAE
jgi:hypothetical protein